jgi:hypothetical protein
LEACKIIVFVDAQRFFAFRVEGLGMVFFVSRKARKGAKTQRIFFETDTKFFCKTKLLLNGKYFKLPPWGIEGAF